MRHNVHDRIFLFCCMAVAFFLPVYGRLVPPFIALMFLNWIIDGRFIGNFGRLFRDSARWQVLSFALIYLLYIMGMSWSTNHDYGWFDLEVKLSLLVFPLIFASLPWSLFVNREKIMWSFISGCVTGSVILLGHAVWDTFENHAVNAFYYIPLAWSFHPSYLAMYFNLAIVFILVRFQDEETGWFKQLFLSLLVVLFMLMILLFSSKAGLICLLGSVSIVSISSVAIRRRVFPGLIFIGMLVAIGLFALLVTPRVYNRFSAVNPALTGQTEPSRISSESNADRVAIWHASIGIIHDNFWIGTGTGDVKDALQHSYTLQKIVPAYRLRLNAHSQYLQTFITLGITGFLLLVFMLVLPAIRALRNRDLLYLLFISVFAFNILVESMLEEQAGVVYYAFFNTLLFAMQKQTGTQFPVSPSESK